VTTLSSAGRRPASNLVLVLAAGSLVTALSLGVRSTFGLFLDPVVDTFASGRGAFALAIAIQNLAWGLSQPIAGAIADRYGTARVLLVGAVLYSLGLVLMSQSSSAGTLWLSVGFLVGVANGAASFSVVLAAVGRMAGPARRSMALGVVSAMGSVGQFLLIPLVRWMIDDAGWRSTALLLGAVVLLAMVGTPLLRGRASDQSIDDEGSAPAVPLGQELRRARASVSYWLLNLGFFVCGFHVTYIATHLASYAEDIGQTRATAATALSLIGLFNVAGSLAAGWLGGRFSKTRLLSGIYGARAVVIAAFVVVPTTPTTVMVFGAAMGVLWLSTVPLTSGIVASQFGTAHSGTLFGIVFLSHQIGAFIGAWMGGTLSDRFGSYTPAWWVAVALGVMAAVVHWFIDEGPQPEPTGTGLDPVLHLGPAAVVVVVSLGSAAALGSSVSSPESGDGLWCPLHPIVVAFADPPP
jgi:predicted MFS family arabinose efflux permease